MPGMVKELFQEGRSDTLRGHAFFRELGQSDPSMDAWMCCFTAHGVMGCWSLRWWVITPCFDLFVCHYIYIYTYMYIYVCIYIYILNSVKTLQIWRLNMIWITHVVLVGSLWFPGCMLVNIFMIIPGGSWLLQPPVGGHATVTGGVLIGSNMLRHACHPNTA